MHDLIDESIANWGAIRLLTKQHGSSIVITAPGLDYALDPVASVICHGDWTPPEGYTFTGDTHLEALSRAVEAYTEKTRSR